MRLWICLWMGGATVAMAQQPLLIDGHEDHISLTGYSEFWIDDSGQMLPEQVSEREASLPFTARKEQQVHLIDGKAIWIRFDIQVTDGRRHWLLELPSPSLDLAELYYRKPDGSWVHEMAGDTLPLATWPQAARYPVFALSSELGQPVHYLLRVQQLRSPFSSALVVETRTRMAAEHERAALLLGLYFGLAILSVLVGTAAALSYRDAAFGTYTLYVLLLALSQAAFTGIAGMYLWPAMPRWSNVAGFLLPLLAGGAALWFVRTVINPKQFSEGLDRFMLALALLLVLGGCIDAMAPTIEGFKVNTTMISAGMLVMVLVMGLAVLEKAEHARWMALGFSPVLLGALFPVLRNFGLLPSGNLTSYSLMLGSALEIPILSYGLYRRLNQRREAAVRQRALAQTDAMTGLPHERVLLQRLQGSLLRARRYQQPCALMLVDFSNYPALLQAHGREAAERSLVVAASRLRSVVRDVDTAARVGEHVFALLIEAPSDAPDALGVATHAVARGLHASPLLPGSETLRFRVVVALLPWDEYDAGQVLHWMREGLASLDERSPKAIQTLNF